MKPTLLSVFVSLATLSASMHAQACKCVGPSSYDAVFEGRVVRMAKAPGQAEPLTEVEFLVSRSVTGSVTERTVVFTPVPVLLCGVPFKAGQRYLVRAALVGRRLETLDCYGTKKL